MTQDVDAGLQPAFQVTDKLKRQADLIFEKEQEYLVEAANKKSKKKKDEFFVNEHGYGNHI